MPCHAARHAVTAVTVVYIADSAAGARVNVFQINNRVCIGERVSRVGRHHEIQREDS
jgi:hypothetical protein